MQQEAVQAMLVACISYNDRSISHGQNELLNKYCDPFMQQLGTVLPNLLKPAGATNQPLGGSKQAGLPRGRMACMHYFRPRDEVR
jgi:hypothetical protein